MSVVISDETLQAARMSASELKQEIAIVLFQKNKLTLGQASRLAEMNQLQFQHVLASRHIALHYEVDDFEADLATLRNLDRL
jgi:predicted HTH domain antitoxin